MLMIIDGNVPYEEACCTLGVLSSLDGRLQLCDILFKYINEQRLSYFSFTFTANAKLLR